MNVITNLAKTIVELSEINESLRSQNDALTTENLRLAAELASYRLRSSASTAGKTGEQLWWELTFEQRADVIDVYEEFGGQNLIAAVKRVRELSGWGLKESKDAFDYYRSTLAA